MVDGAAWRPIAWGDGNYFASTLNNVFSSRRALLSGNQQTASSSPQRATVAAATATVTVPHDGLFSVLVRYEGIYHFNTGFRVTIAQRGATVFDRVYGLRGNLKLWDFVNGRLHGGVALRVPGSCQPGDLLTAECSWTYGATEGMLWEGIGANAKLEAGTAAITLSMDNATATDDMVDSPEAMRNIDLIVLHPNQTDVMGRATKWETSSLALPLDGYASQHGEVFARFLNTGVSDLNMTLAAMTGHSGAGDNHLNLAVWDNATQTLTSGCSSKGDQTFIHGYSTATSPPVSCHRLLNLTQRYYLRASRLHLSLIYRVFAVGCGWPTLSSCVATTR